MGQLGEAAIREIVADVIRRLNDVPSARAPQPGATGRQARRGTFGIFQDVGEACAAAQEAYLQLQEQGVEARRKIVRVVKQLVRANAEPWGRIELDETKI